jgi:outer membrane protein
MNTFKKLITTTTLLMFFAAFSASAQKYCFVNSEYILEQIPAYKDAQAQLDQLSIK